MAFKQAIWLASTLISVVAIVGLSFVIPRREPARSTPGRRGLWLLAATTSGTLLTFISATVIGLLPNATAIDVGALALTGILTGVFLALGLEPSSGHGVS